MTHKQLQQKIARLKPTADGTDGTVLLIGKLSDYGRGYEQAILDVLEVLRLEEGEVLKNFESKCCEKCRITKIEDVGKGSCKKINCPCHSGVESVVYLRNGKKSTL